MTFFYMYNPKMFWDPGGLKSIEPDPIKRKEEERVIEVVRKELPKKVGVKSNKTKELQGRINTFVGLSAKIEQLKEDKRVLDLKAQEQKIKELFEIRKGLASVILDMVEEEDVVIALLLLN